MSGDHLHPGGRDIGAANRVLFSIVRELTLDRLGDDRRELDAKIVEMRAIIGEGDMRHEGALALDPVFTRLLAAEEPTWRPFCLYVTAVGELILEQTALGEN